MDDWARSMGAAFSQLAVANVLVVMVTVAITSAVITIVALVVFVVVGITNASTTAACAIDRRIVWQHFLHVVGNAAAAHHRPHGYHARTLVVTSTIGAVAAAAATAATTAATYVTTAV